MIWLFDFIEYFGALLETGAQLSIPDSRSYDIKEEDVHTDRDREGKKVLGSKHMSLSQLLLGG